MGYCGIYLPTADIQARGQDGNGDKTMTIKFMFTEKERDILKGIRERDKLLKELFARVNPQYGDRMQAYKELAGFFNLKPRTVKAIITGEGNKKRRG